MAACSPVACQISVTLSPGLMVCGAMLKEMTPTGSAVAGAGVVGVAVLLAVGAGEGDICGAAVSDGADGNGVEVGIAGSGVDVWPAGKVGAATVAAAVGGSTVSVSAEVIIAMAVGEAAVGLLVTDCGVAVMRAAVGGAGVTVGIQPAQKAIMARASSTPGRRPMLPLYTCSSCHNPAAAGVGLYGTDAHGRPWADT